MDDLLKATPLQIVAPEVKVTLQFWIVSGTRATTLAHILHTYMHTIATPDLIKST